MICWSYVVPILLGAIGVQDLIKKHCQQNIACCQNSPSGAVSRNSTHIFLHLLIYNAGRRPGRTRAALCGSWGCALVGFNPNNLFFFFGKCGLSFYRCSHLRPLFPVLLPRWSFTVTFIQGTKSKLNYSHLLPGPPSEPWRTSETCWSADAQAIHQPEHRLENSLLIGWPFYKTLRSIRPL